MSALSLRRFVKNLQWVGLSVSQVWGYNSSMSTHEHQPYTDEYLKAAHKHTIYHRSEIESSSVCCCYYCGHQFDPRDPELELAYTDINNRKGLDETLLCPLCGIDCVLGDASGYPVAEPEFIQAMTTYWFDGYSRIDEGIPPQKVEWINVKVD